MDTIITMYVTLMPVIFAGSLNMFWVKQKFLSKLYIPIDKGLVLNDGRRLFGDNKTWKGFIGMIFSGMIMTVIWGVICQLIPYLGSHNYLYINYANTVLYNMFVGALLGFSYVICELPNSFLKRRLDIIPGKRGSGIKGKIFSFVDEIDSLIGCVFVLNLFYPMSFVFSMFYILLGGITHYFINILLYQLKLRDNKN